MPRPPRLEFPEAVYHVTTRGNERKAIFRDDRDREEFLHGLAKYRDRFGFRLLAFCLMTNHVHLAIRTDEAPLSRIMASLQSRYAQRFNRRHRRVGHLFQGRYKSLLVQQDRHLIALIRYIHWNPVRARIVRRSRDYPWSSDRYLRAGRGPEWLDVDATLSYLAATRARAVARYVELVDGPTADSDGSALSVVAGAIEGDEAFALERFCAAREPRPAIPGLTVERVLDVVARHTGISVGALSGPRRGGDVSRSRALAAYLARRLGRISVRTMARRLGRDDSSFVRPIARLEAGLESDPALRHQLDRIIRDLTCPTPPPKSANQD
jgi:putative transposase